MGRKITMTGRNAQYIEHRGVNATPDQDRDIRMEGENAVYSEYAYGQTVQAQRQEETVAYATGASPEDTAGDLLENLAENTDNASCIGECFRNASEFVRLLVTDIVTDYYLGSAANLALIETALYDHNLLFKRNRHKALVKSLMAWGAIASASEQEISKMTNSMAYKMRCLPPSGYKEWKDDAFVNDRKTCSDIGAKLGPTIPYSRKKAG